MRLAKLTLAGFKSFADSTEFRFDMPVTGIVGPNGCGKSNVVDAVKWVLGERSAKSLRGKEMLDVIFAGSAGRKPGGLASVILTFENPVRPEPVGRIDDSDIDVLLGEDDPAGEAGTEMQTDAGDGSDQRVAESREGEAADGAADRASSKPRGPRRWLAIDAETVDIERRLYRDGTSEYLINNRKVRLKDIRELFMDTGVGAHAYSIIEQGRVDALLLANPVERRTFFEEAAGIAKFRARRIEAERKLDRAERNLAVVREQLDSTERRLRIVKGQAAKARKFQELDAEYRGLKAAEAFDIYDDLCVTLSGLTSRMIAIEGERAAALEAVERAERVREKLEVQRGRLVSDRQALEHERAAAAHEAAGASQRRDHALATAQEFEQQLQRDRSRASEMLARLDDLQAAWDEESTRCEELRQAAVTAQSQLDEAVEKRAARHESLAELRTRLSSARTEASGIDRERSAAEARRDAERQRLSQAEDRRSSVGEAVTRLTTELEQVAEDRTRAERDAEASATAVREGEKSVEERLANASRLDTAQRELTTRVHERERERAKQTSRAGTLRELITSREGFEEPVRTVLSLRDESDEGHALRRIVGPLGELIEVDQADAAAVEAALGDSLQGLVVRGGHDAIDRALIEALPARVRLLPARERVTPSALVDELSRVPGRVRLASGVVRGPEWMRGLIERMLGKTLLVANLDAAEMLAAGPLAHQGWRFVTADGLVLEADGSVVAGPVTQGTHGAGMLARRSELHDLDGSIASLTELLDADTRELDALAGEASRVNEALAEARRTLIDHQRRATEAERARDRSTSEHSRLERELANAREEHAELETRIKAIRDESMELSETIERLRRLHEERTALVDQLERELASEQTESDRLGERVAELRGEVGGMSERLIAAEREVRRLAAERESVERDRMRLVSESEQIEGRIESQQAAAAEALERHSEALERASAADEKVRALVNEIEAVASRADEAGETLRAARDAASTIDRDWRGLELAKREAEMRREHHEERARDELSIDLPMALGEYRAMMAGGDVVRIDRTEVAATAEELAKDLKALGNVNLDAIEEEHTLEEKNEDLEAQVADIDAARAHLEELISQLAEVSRERFKKSFEMIQAHFSGRDGMFRKLFGGGQAELRLLPVMKENAEGEKVPGDIDLLESGIEVIAKPPGKEPRAISQLSGGEKTMTAVALLMSIFESKPSPFCILDEVDAALDDANVDRFGGVIRSFLGKCQFVVITHNKKTMHLADQLIGVTQQERGVSTRVAVRLDQVGAGGEIRGAGKAAVSEAEGKPEPEHAGV